MDGDDQDDDPGAWYPHGLVDGAHLTDDTPQASELYEMGSITKREPGNDLIINNSFTDAEPCTVGTWPTATDDGETERETTQLGCTKWKLGDSQKQRRPRGNEKRLTRQPGSGANPPRGK